MDGAIHVFDRLPELDFAENASDGDAVAPVRAVPLVGHIRNARSHGNLGQENNAAGLAGVVTASPKKRGELHDIVADFAAKKVDYIAIDGGDGTVRDVLTCGAGLFGDHWPTIILLPSGKTNALGNDLGVTENWTMQTALEAAGRGKTVMRRPLVIAQSDNDAAQVRGFVMGGGIFTRSISLGQSAHNFGAFNAAVVGVTTAWTILQAFFGSRNNSWRRGTRMSLRDEQGKEIQHAGGGPFSERFFMLASTMQKLPAGLSPFREFDSSIRLAVLDNPRRSLLLRIPVIVRGTFGEKTRAKGFHTHGLESFSFDTAGAFILDGEAFPPGSYKVTPGPQLNFVVP